MNWNRREFIVLSSLAAASGVFAAPEAFGLQQSQTPSPQTPSSQPAAPPVTPKFESLRRNVGTFSARGGTIGWLITPEAFVVVDSQFADTAQMFLDGSKQRTPRQKIDLLVNSHHHGDHTGGNKTLQPSTAKIVAHENVPALQRKQAATNKSEAAQAYADTTFRDTWKADLGGEVVSAKHYGPGHTGGDIVIFFERANVVHMGDLMFNRRHPRIDRPGGASIRNWIVTLEKIVADHGADTSYIFGHAKAGEKIVGTRTELLGLRDYFTAMLEHVRKEIAAGKSAEEIAKGDVPGFTDYEGRPGLQVAYEELTAKS